MRHQTNPKIKKYWSEEANAWVDESYTSGGAIGKTPCKACQQEVSELKFGYCSACQEDMSKADLHLAIRNHIPKDWRIGQFIMNLLQFLAIDAESPNLKSISKERGIADIFHIPDDKLMSYWFNFTEKWKEKEALANYIKEIK